MKRRILYPSLFFVTLAPNVWLFYFMSTYSEFDLAASVFVGLFIGLMALIDVVVFIIYEIKHKNLSQNILIKTNFIYKSIIFLIILLNVWYIVIFWLFAEFFTFPSYILYTVPYLFLWLFILCILYFHTVLINKNLSKGHYFNIFVALLVAASVTLCASLFNEIWRAEWRHQYSNLILKTTYIENDLDKCVRLTDNAYRCVLHFASKSNNTAVCDEYAKYYKEYGGGFDISSFVTNCKFDFLGYK